MIYLGKDPVGVSNTVTPIDDNAGIGDTDKVWSADKSANELNDKISDVQVNGTSVVQNGVANVPIASASQLGLVKYDTNYGVYVTQSGLLCTVYARGSGIKGGANQLAPIVPYVQHESTFYGLAKAAGDSTQSQSSNAVGTYTEAAKAAIQTMLGVPDIQIDGTSIVQDGVANIPKASANTFGVTQVSDTYGTQIRNDVLSLAPATDSYIKLGTDFFRPIAPARQDQSVFWGLAKVAGADMKNISDATVGQYPEAQKSAISEMLNGSVSVSGSTPVITALPGVRYVCGECTTLDITLPNSGCIDVVFESGSTSTVLTITGTVKWANGFDPTNIAQNATYEINILDGLGVACVWM